MKYERLTKRVDNYPKIKYCSKDCETISCIDCGCCDELDYALYRLAELEDKIENGTLVELPCKVGDTVYEVIYDKYSSTLTFINKSIIEKIVITKKGLRLKLARNSVYETAISSLGKTIFLTKAEAEKRLEELQKQLEELRGAK